MSFAHAFAVMVIASSTLLVGVMETVFAPGEEQGIAGSRPQDLDAAGPAAAEQVADAECDADDAGIHDLGPCSCDATRAGAIQPATGGLPCADPRHRDWRRGCTMDLIRGPPVRA